MSGCTCDACRACCERTPGWLLPADVERLAARLGVEVLDLFRTHLAFDYWCEVPGDALGHVFVVSPATSQAPPGTDMPFGAPLSGENRCLLYNKEGRCTIYPVRPTECRESFGCKTTRGDATRRRTIAAAWNEPKARALVRVLRAALGLHA